MQLVYWTASRDSAGKWYSWCARFVLINSTNVTTKVIPTVLGSRWHITMISPFLIVHCSSIKGRMLIAAYKLRWSLLNSHYFMFQIFVAPFNCYRFYLKGTDLQPWSFLHDLKKRTALEDMTELMMRVDHQHLFVHFSISVKRWNEEKVWNTE